MLLSKFGGFQQFLGSNQRAISRGPGRNFGMGGGAVISGSVFLNGVGPIEPQISLSSNAQTNNSILVSGAGNPYKIVVQYAI